MENIFPGLSHLLFWRRVLHTIIVVKESIRLFRRICIFILQSMLIRLEKKSIMTFIYLIKLLMPKQKHGVKMNIK